MRKISIGEFIVIEQVKVAMMMRSRHTRVIWPIDRMGMNDEKAVVQVMKVQAADETEMGEDEDSQQNRRGDWFESLLRQDSYLMFNNGWIIIKMRHSCKEKIVSLNRKIFYE